MNALLRWVAVSVMLPVAGALGSGLEDGFRAPPPAAHPKTYWFWVNGNATWDGITRDLEAMKRVGIGGAFMFDGSTYMPAGPASYMSPEWRKLMNHAVQEGHRLGLEIGMHNGPGWSSSGGPWITPERSMKELVWTEATASGPGPVDVSLAQPQTIDGFYRDAFLLVFPTPAAEAQPYGRLVSRVATADGSAVAPEILCDGLLDTGVQVSPDNYLQLEFKEPITARAVSVNVPVGGKFPPVEVEASEDGVTYRTVCHVTDPGAHGIRAPGAFNFPAVSARFFRFVPAGPCFLSEAVLHRTPRIEGWVFKANLTYHVGRQVEIPPPGPREFAIDPAQVRDLTGMMGPDGRLHWQAPPGSWTLLRIGYTTTGHLNVSASKAGTGLECDKMDREATEFHFANTVAKVAADAGALLDKSFTMVEIDSYEAGMQNWTAAFPDEFRRRAGYDLRSFLPAMTGRIVGDAGVSERFLFDVRRVQSDLMTGYYYGRMEELCRQRGLDFYVEGYGQGVFDELRLCGLPDFPMTEFWQRTPWTENRTVKMVSSAAHIYGKPVVASESFTGEEETSRWEEYPYSLKILGDTMFSLGLNEMVFHRNVQQPHPSAVPGMAMGPWGFHMDRNTTWFGQSADWIGYLSRCQYLLRQGVSVADLLYFVGERPPNVAQFTIPALPAGFDYDLVDAEVLLTRARVRDGNIVLPEGTSYRVLVLPEDLKGVTPAFMARLRELVEQGATVLGPKPEHSLTLRGYPDAEAEVRREADALWGTGRAGAGRVISGEPVGDALRELKIEPDFTYAGRRPDTALVWVHRKLADLDIYFVANRQRRPEDVVCSFRVAGLQPEIWQAETGKMTLAAVYAAANGRVSLPLHLAPAESVFVVFQRPAAERPAQWLARDGARILETVPPAPAQSPAIENTFTMAVWAKPDIDLRLLPAESVTGTIDETGKFYAVPAPEGDRLFGPGHACAGLAVGRNGIYVIERSRPSSPAVLVARMPVSGWTHVAVVYRDGTPRLFVNGVFVREGLRSGSIVHPGVGLPAATPDTVFHCKDLDHLVNVSGLPTPPSQGRAFYFEGNMAFPEVMDRALSDGAVADLASRPLPPPPEGAEVELSLGPDGGVEGRFWRSGTYTLEGGRSVKVDLTPPVDLPGPWSVAFQEGRGAPASITLPALASLRLNADPGVRYFSGTATYSRPLDVPAGLLGDGRRVILDLGRVEVMARVRINGRDLGNLWKEPYQMDVTDAVHPGANDLEVAVTDLWPNRLIGDEQLPPENEYRAGPEHGVLVTPEWYAKGEPKPPGGRITFATWKFFNKDEPLLESGLLGPVRLLNPQDRKF